MGWTYAVIALGGMMGIAGWVVGLISLKRGKHARQLVMTGVLAGTSVVIVMTILQALALRAQNTEKREVQYSGLLESAGRTVLSVQQGLFPEMKMGRSDSVLVWGDRQGELVKALSEDHGLILWVDKNGNLKVSVKVRNKQGQLIAEIIGNEWKVARDEALSWDRNFDSTALEVKDDEGNVILQVIFENEFLRFSAKMYGADGQGIGIGSINVPGRLAANSMEFLHEMFGDHEVQGGGIVISDADDVAFAIFESAPSGDSLKLQIDPIFEYPSQLRMGQRRG